jgi:hypothetical protein
MLWTPLFLLFWLSLHKREGNGAGVLWAFLLGTLVSIIHYSAGSFIAPKGFGLSRWLYALVDVIFLPAALPFLAALILTLCRSSKAGCDLRIFALVWLIPEGVFRSIQAGSRANPLFLILVPLLWTAVAAGLPLFIDLSRGRYRILVIPCALGAGVLPLAAASCFWAFFGQRAILGALILAAALVPAVISTVIAASRGS